MITSTHYRRLPEFRGHELPIRLHESPTSNSLLQSFVRPLTIAVLLIASPAFVYAVFVLGEADFASLTGSAYRFAAAVVLGILVAALFARNIFAQIAHHLGRSRIITINETQITVREKNLFGCREWREPLAGYRGVERQQWATANGWQFRLILAHPQPERQVPVWVGDQIPDVLVAGYQSLLNRSTAHQTAT